MTISLVYFFGYSLGGFSQELPLDSIVWEERDINVCWINPEDSDEKEREWVRLAVKRTWETDSPLTFNGWKKCELYDPKNNNSVRIRISNNEVKTSGIGKLVVKDSVALNLSFDFTSGVFRPTISKETIDPESGDFLPTNFKKISLNNIVPTNEIGRRILIEAQAVHEFGHILGFSHEQGKSDCNYGETCVPEYNHLVYNINLLVSCNERSVMNYCNDIYLNQGYLSPQDVQLVQKVYGMPELSESIDKPFLESEIKGKMFSSNKTEQQRQESPTRVKYKSKQVLITVNNIEYDKVKFVEYYFHQGTFNNQVVYPNEKGNFPILLKKVWGKFVAQAKIYYKDGSEFIVSKYIDVSANTKYKYGWSIPDKSTRQN